MFDSLKNHTPEKLEKLLEKYADSASLGATRRLLKRNMYLGDDATLLAYASNSMIGVDDEHAEFYARKAISNYPCSGQASLWALPDIKGLDESDLEKVLLFLDNLLPSQQQYSLAPLTKEEIKKFSSFIGEDYYDPQMLREDGLLGAFRKHYNQIRFANNNYYSGNNINILVGLSNTYHSSYDFFKKTYILDIQQFFPDKICSIDAFNSLATSYAKKAIDINPKDYTLLKRLRCLFTKRTQASESLFENIVKNWRGSSGDVLNMLDGVFAHDIEHIDQQLWALDTFLKKEPDNLSYLRRAAKLNYDQYKNNTYKFDLFTGDLSSFSKAKVFKKQANAYYAKIYSISKDASEIPPDILREFAYGSAHNSREQQASNRWSEYFKNFYSGPFGPNPFNFDPFSSGPFDFDPFGSTRNNRSYYGGSSGGQYRQQNGQGHAAPRQSKMDVAFATLGIKPETPYDDAYNTYRKLAIQYHPDINKSHDAESKMKDINSAWCDLKKNYYQKA